jgi:16S rRNA (adenine1518-N6/adenine1519-N6)-dimethyltransferase
VVHIKPKAVDGTVAVRDLENVTKAAFGQRRKMVRQSLKSLGVPVEGLLAAAGLKGDERAEDLPVEAFLGMAQALPELRRAPKV